jgi:DNA (cytosine-5)-methyltransferase 1
VTMDLANEGLVGPSVPARAGRPPVLRLYGDELDLDGFAGGGGASTGMEMALGVSPAIAINHDPIALAMHEANHPETRHVVSNIRRVRYEHEVPPGVRIRVAWFSPDCTHHSKARGGKPFRDPLKARRIRGLAWEAVRCAKALGDRAPRLIVIENVEEWRDWCPLLPDGTPDWSRRGENYRRWKREMAKAGPGYVVEERELVACDYGDPTKRKRLFIICRSDGLPIAWPEPTHGPGRAHPYRTAAECIDFSLPVPSIFLTQRQAYAWAKRQGLPKSAAPRRPLATATKKRIARGVFRYVLNDPNPFIICANVKRGHFALVAPVLVGVGGRKGQSPETPVTRPFHTITAKRDTALVAAFLAKHHGNGTGHDATGQRLERPIDTIITRDNKSLITSHMVKLRGGLADHPNTAQDLRRPAPTATAGGTHYAEVRVTLVPRDSLDPAYAATAVKTCAFLVKYFGTGVARRLDQPLGTLTTKDRIGLVEVILVRVGDTEWVLADIGMRMLTPRELFRCQGFPPDYEIEHVPVQGVGLQRLTKKAQTRLVGNSVPPHVAAAIIRAPTWSPRREKWSVSREVRHHRRRRVLDSRGVDLLAVWPFRVREARGRIDLVSPGEHHALALVLSHRKHAGGATA